MKSIVIKVPVELSEAIESRQLELSGLERLIGFALSTTAYEIPVSKVEELQNKYIAVNAEYELLKQQVTDLVPSDFDLSKTSWSLDFKNCEATISEE